VQRFRQALSGRFREPVICIAPAVRGFRAKGLDCEAQIELRLGVASLGAGRIMARGMAEVVIGRDLGGARSGEQERQS